MNNLQRYTNVFTETFGITEQEANNLEYMGISDWDSVGHMSLVAAVEDTFEIMMETDDIIDFSSFQKGIELLKKYDIDMSV